MRTFEEWWDINYVRKGFMGNQPGVLGAAFKEVAQKAWEAGYYEAEVVASSEGYEEGYRDGWAGKSEECEEL